jgi:hypothetical protein
VGMSVHRFEHSPIINPVRSTLLADAPVSMHAKNPNAVGPVLLLWV